MCLLPFGEIKLNKMYIYIHIMSSIIIFIVNKLVVVNFMKHFQLRKFVGKY